MVQEATFAPTTLLPSEVRAALSPHTVPAAAPVLPGPQQPGGVRLGLAWLLWGGGPGASPRQNRGPPTPSRTRQEEVRPASLTWGELSGTDSVHPSAATGTAKPQPRASFGCQTGLNHWTHLVQKAPKANRQELVLRLPSGSSHLCPPPSSVSGLLPGGGCLSVLPQPSSDSTAAGTTGGLCLPPGTVSAPRWPQCPAVPTALCAGDGGPVTAGRGAAVPALIKQRHILGLLARRHE